MIPLLFWLGRLPVHAGSAGEPDKHRRNKMAYVITNKCTNCGSCVEVCPVEAISKGDKKHNIDADKCVDCGACAGECPVEAIEPGA
jgi:ferredoxin